MKTIKDLIYFDHEKAKSLSSQLGGGIINELTRAIEEEGGFSAEIGFDIKVLKTKGGSTDKSKTNRTEKIEVFHELLNQIELSLREHNILTDLNLDFESYDKSFNDYMKKIPSLTYIKATGWSVFEDYERFKKIMNNFNDIQRLIHGSSSEADQDTKQIREQINEIKKGIKANPNANHAKELAKLKVIESNFDKALQSKHNFQLLDETFIERVKTFLNTFSPDRLNFRLAPFDVFNDFQILANLKSRYLLDGSFENVIFNYGSRPNVKLSAFGIITSCPQKEDVRRDLSDEYLGYSDDELKEEVLFEKAFRNIFSSFEAFEKFFFVPNYPKIAISPITIYREIQLFKQTS